MPSRPPPTPLFAGMTPTSLQRPLSSPALAGGHSLSPLRAQQYLCSQAGRRPVPRPRGQTISGLWLRLEEGVPGSPELRGVDACVSGAVEKQASSAGGLAQKAWGLPGCRAQTEPCLSCFSDCVWVLGAPFPHPLSPAFPAPAEAWNCFLSCKEVGGSCPWDASPTCCAWV